MALPIVSFFIPPGTWQLFFPHGSTFAITGHPWSMVLSKQFYISVLKIRVSLCLPIPWLPDWSRWTSLGLVLYRQPEPPLITTSLGKKFAMRTSDNGGKSCRTGALGCCCYSVRMFTRNQIMRIHLPIAQNCLVTGSQKEIWALSTRRNGIPVGHFFCQVLSLSWDVLVPKPIVTAIN